MAGDDRGAVRSYVGAIAAAPGYARAHFNLGRHYHGLGVHDFALREYTASLGVRAAASERREPRRHLALLNRGAARLECGDVAEAIADFDAVLAAQVLKNAASSLVEDMGCVLRRRSLALVLQPASVAAYVNRARARVVLGEWVPAERDYLAALRLTPLDKTLYREVSAVYQQLIEVRGAAATKEALRHYATFLELDDGIVPGPRPSSEAVAAMAARPPPRPWAGCFVEGGSAEAEAAATGAERPDDAYWKLAALPVGYATWRLKTSEDAPRQTWRMRDLVGPAV
jgi:tetratricopeptide (TPR) repeat protein